MLLPTPQVQRERPLRALALAVIALGVAWFTWRVRPAAPNATSPPDTDIVLACAWLAWALAGYLAIAIAATALGHVLPAAGLASEALTRLAPAQLRRLVEVAVTVSVAATVLGSSGAAFAAASTPLRVSSVQAPGPTRTGSLDWPGLPARAHGATPSRPTAPAQPRRPLHHRPANVGLVTSAGPVTAPAVNGSGGDVIVRSGDTLWKIAARHLGPTASVEATVTAWHQWYAVNRLVVGADPDLIHPGQRLRPPAHPASTLQTGSSR
jgi:nucleoid-associated protein YgaU